MITSLDIEYQAQSSVVIIDGNAISIDIVNAPPVEIEVSMVNPGPPGPKGDPGEPGLTTIGTLEDLTDVDTLTKQPGQFLYYDGSEWTSAPLDGGTFN